MVRNLIQVEEGCGISVHVDHFNDAKAELLSSNPIIMELEHHHEQNHIRLMDWDSLVYENLTVPLYSGLVVRMLIHLSPSRIEDVGRFEHYWNDVFKERRGDIVKWLEDATNLNENEGIYICLIDVSSCNSDIICSMLSGCTVDTDLVFVLDESGSITEPNFMTVKNFAYNFTSELLTTDSDSDMQMTRRTTGSRVGVITFDSDATE